ncbi:MAG: glycosyltransferase, partial [Ginsengibacter sp.]
YCDKKFLTFIKKNAGEIFSNASSIIVSSEFEKTILKKYHSDSAQKIQVVYEGVNSKGTVLGLEEREEIKEKFAEGNEYFIYPGIISPLKNLVNLLKAFSAFKKRQRSGMQLIIAGEKGKGFDEFIHSVDLYRFKKEVKILTQLSAEESKKIIAAAYATILPATNEVTATAALQSLQCDVPVIGCSVGAVPEICGDAGSYFAAGDYKNITEKMMLLFKDEKLRSELITKGRKESEKHDWKYGAQLTWKIISENLPKK